MDRATEAEVDVASGQVLGNGPGVGQGASQAVELGEDEGVAGPAGGQGLAQSRPLPVGTGEAVVDVGPLDAHAQGGEGLSLAVRFCWSVETRA